MKSLTFLIFLITPLLTNFSAPANHVRYHDEVSREKIATAVLQAFVKEDYDAVTQNFHTSLTQTFSKEKIAEIWEKVNDQVGKYVETISVTPSVYGQYNQLKLRCKFERGTLSLQVTFTQDDKIIGLSFPP